MTPQQIKLLLVKRNIKFIDIDRKHGLRQGGTRFAVSKPFAKGEQALSKELNIPLQELFPDRYNKEGKRYSPQPVENYTYKTMQTR